MCDTTVQNNSSILWTDLLAPIGRQPSLWQLFMFLYNKEHAYSNYHKCLKRNYDQVRKDVYEDKAIRKLIEQNRNNAAKIDAILDEMCHMLSSQQNPTRRLKITGIWFIKCITKIYSAIYVNNHLLPIQNGLRQQRYSFKDEFLQMSKDLPIVILPTHRSYMDFLLVAYIMVHYEMPLPCVATGDNFKAMGTICTNYLKTTGAFLVRRNAQKKKDVEANIYYDILRAYVHSILKGGENPLEFFMEGTRTRVGQVLRPKTGLLSMICDVFLEDMSSDVYIMPVAINYQRPIEEQLYIAENTPQVNKKKPRESAINLLNGISAIMKRDYGKVYVRFLQPFRLSDYYDQWKAVTKLDVSVAKNPKELLESFTKSLSSKVCLAQAEYNILMPFHILATVMLSRSFFLESSESQPALDQPVSEQPETLTLTLTDLMHDFDHIERLLRLTQKQFERVWSNPTDIFNEFTLDRDGIIRADRERGTVEFNLDAIAFQTLLYYSNQLLQMILPVAICFILEATENETFKLEQYKEIRSLLSKEFFANESFIEPEFERAIESIKQNQFKSETKSIIVKHMVYFIKSYLIFFDYMQKHDTFCRKSFFHESQKTLFISKDMLKNMMNLVSESGICDVMSNNSDKPKLQRENSINLDDKLQLVDSTQLASLRKRFQKALDLAAEAITSGLVSSNIS